MSTFAKILLPATPCHEHNLIVFVKCGSDFIVCLASKIYVFFVLGFLMKGILIKQSVMA
jgi:hypothetical protein